MSIEGNATTNAELNNLSGRINVIPKTDTTLTKSSYSADAKVTGDAINKLQKQVDIVDANLTEHIKKNNNSGNGEFINGEFISGGATIKKFTGDGSATKRTINTGGTSNACLMYGNEIIALVVNGGGVSFHITDGTITALKNDINIENGVITLATENSQVNAEGVEYNYILL